MILKRNPPRLFHYRDARIGPMIQVNGGEAAHSTETCMWDFYPELFARPAARYTCFPTTTAFLSATADSDHRSGLAAIGNDEPASIYVHIPFCKRICTYCACNTGDANRPLALAAYLARLHQEIELVANALNGRSKIDHVTIGGGSPNAIAPHQFTRLVQHLRDAFALNDGPDISLGMDPRCLTAEFADALANAGVHRASLGVPTFDLEVQHAIGRLQSFENVERAVSLLRQAGVRSLGFELLYGLPLQGETTLIATLLASAALQPDRLSLIGYVHLPQQKARQRRIEATPLPSARSRFSQFRTAYDWLSQRGWMPIGFNEFAQGHDPIALAAKDRRLRRNFQGFTDDQSETIIGLGASAISRFRGALVQNERSSSRYGSIVGRGKLAATRGVKTPPDVRMRGRLIEELLCHGEAEIGRLPDCAAIREAMGPFEVARLVRWYGGKLAFLPGAEAYAEQIAATLDPWSAASAQRRASRNENLLTRRLARSIPKPGDRIGPEIIGRSN